MKNIKKIFIDMIPVVLGILIALFLNNWNDNRNNRQFIQTVLNNIELELQENSSELTNIIQEHQDLVDTISVYMNNEAVSISSILNKANGLRGISIKNTSWKSFLNPNIQNVDYFVISTLTDIDDDKGHLDIFMNKIMDFLYQEFDSNSTNQKLLLQMIIKDMLYTEESLLESHQKFMEYIRDK